MVLDLKINIDKIINKLLDKVLNKSFHISVPIFRTAYQTGPFSDDDKKRWDKQHLYGNYPPLNVVIPITLSLTNNLDKDLILSYIQFDFEGKFGPYVISDKVLKPRTPHRLEVENIINFLDLQKMFHDWENEEKSGSPYSKVPKEITIIAEDTEGCKISKKIPIK